MITKTNNHNKEEENIEYMYMVIMGKSVTWRRNIKNKNSNIWMIIIDRYWWNIPGWLGIFRGLFRETWDSDHPKIDEIFV